ncbi:MAG TPA: FkbM family methyltransferase [Longimicrobiaceae bacterium]|nr:FkbM family methyltransferase [Longimicrobiaceae bacterium]
MAEAREEAVSGEPPAWLRAAAAVVRRLPAGRYRAMNRFRRGRFVARLPAGAGGLRFGCDLRDAISREVFFTGAYGGPETALLRRLLRPGAVFVDVGANWGYFTLLAAALVGPEGRVVAVEPDPRLFARLQANLRANRLAQAAAYPVAAADVRGPLVLRGHDADGGNWGASTLLHRAGDPGERYAVEGRTVDDLLDELKLGRVELLKLDVEGAEEMVLRGMAAGLARGRYRRVLIELHPTLHPRGARLAGDLAAALAAAGYRGWSVDHSPAAVRRAAYGSVADAAGLLRPLHAVGLDAWPHQLWAAPGEEAP